MNFLKPETYKHKQLNTMDLPVDTFTTHTASASGGHLGGEVHATIHDHSGCVGGSAHYHGEHVDLSAGIQKCGQYDHGSLQTYPASGSIKKTQ